MDQDRRDAAAWAQEWRIKSKNRRIIGIIAGIVIACLALFVLNFIKIKMTRTTFASEEEMREAMQGRFVVDQYQEIILDGDDVYLTYYEISHYDIDYAERYGYSEYDDSLYDDKVVEWDYRHGMIRFEWMDDIRVDKDGNLIYFSQTFKRTDAPKPEPFDPALLDEKNIDGDGSEMTEEEQAAEEAAQESREETEDRADLKELEEESEEV